MPHFKFQKLGADLVAGDVLATWDGSHTITGFAAHPGLEAYGKFHSARVAVSGDWAITIFDDEHYEVVNPKEV